MRRTASRLALLGFAVIPVFAAIAQSPEPTAEQVYKDIEVFKGVPASDLMPAMQFMAASMGYTCNDCHVPNDYAAKHEKKTEARKMVLLQRDINNNHFGGRLEVTCMTCHMKEEHPVGMPVPEGVNRRHERISPAPKPQDLVAKHVEASGKLTAAIVRTGTMTSPNETTHQVETSAAEFIQAPGGKFRMVAGEKKFGSDGKATWYGAYPMTDEPAAIFGRIGRTWVGDTDFAGLSRLTVTGKEKVGSADTVVVQGFRAATNSAEELYFDTKSGLLVRLVNFRRSTIGTVVSMMEFENYTKVGEALLPMKVTVTYAEGSQWVMDFKFGKVDPSVKEDVFKLGG